MDGPDPEKEKISDDKQHPVCVRAKFTLPSDSSSPVVHHTFDESNCAPAILGLADGVAAKKPEAGDTSYSGMHDHGPLPPPKEGGPYAQLIGCVGKVKQESDSLLTKLIESEKEIDKTRKGKVVQKTSAGQKRSRAR